MRRMWTIVLAAAVLPVAVLAAGISWHAVDTWTTGRAWEHLLTQAAAPAGVFSAGLVATLPEPVQRYFRFSIAEGTPLHSLVELTLRGDIGLGDKQAPGYQSFVAKQLLGADQFIWRATAGAGLMRIDGSDALVAGEGWTHFWLLGIVPVVRAGGRQDYARSAFGRIVAESVFWAPTLLLPGADVEWSATGKDSITVSVRRGGFRQDAHLEIGADGRPLSVVIPRWSNANPDKIWRIQPFGGTGSAFLKFGGLTLATHLEGGNFFGTQAYFPFYRATVEAVTLR